MTGSETDFAIVLGMFGDWSEIPAETVNGRPVDAIVAGLSASGLLEHRRRLDGEHEYRQSLHGETVFADLQWAAEYLASQNG